MDERFMDKDKIKRHGKDSGTFYFKEFKVEDGRSTMKVGTDAVLLGAVANPEGASDILEIGTGSGVIALIMAQKCTASIDAIDIDEDSAGQANENFRNSPWKGRIAAFHTSLQDYRANTKKKYDLIISNPPYFCGDLKSSEKKRNIARHDDALGFKELIGYSSLLLKSKGSIWVILPVKESEEFIIQAEQSGYTISFVMEIFPKEGKPAYRKIMQFRKGAVRQVVMESLIIRKEDSSYTEKYKQLTKAFYLDF